MAPKEPEHDEGLCRNVALCKCVNAPCTLLASHSGEQGLLHRHMDSTCQFVHVSSVTRLLLALV